MGPAYCSLGRTKVLYATSLVLLGAKAKFLRRKPSVLAALEKNLKCVDPNPYYQRWLCQGLFVKGVIKENLYVMLMPGHSHRMTFGHIELHLPISFPLS